MDASWEKELWGSLYPFIEQSSRIQQEYYVDAEPFDDYMPTLGKAVAQLAKKDPNYMLLLYASTLCQMAYVVLCCFVHYVPPNSDLCEELLVETYAVMFDTASSLKVEDRMIELIVGVVVKDMQKSRPSTERSAQELTTNDLIRYVREISKNKMGVSLMGAEVPNVQKREIDLYGRVVDVGIVRQRCVGLLEFYNRIADTVSEIAESLKPDIPLKGIAKRNLRSSQLKRTVLTPIVEGIVNGVNDSFVFEAREQEMNLVHMVYF